MVSTFVLSGSKVTKTYILLSGLAFTSYTPSIFSRIARILPAVSSQVHAGTYNLTIRAVSGITLVGACVVAHDKRTRPTSKITILFLCNMISSFLRSFMK
jgi:hypothetical protein